MSSLRAIAREAQSRQWWSRALLYGLIASVALAVVLAVPFQRWRDRRFAAVLIAQGRGALDREDFATAFAQMMTAARLVPADPQVLRLAIDLEIAADTDPLHTIQVFAKLAAIEPVSDDDQLKLARLHFRCGQFPAMMTALQSLRPAARERWEVIELQTDLLLHQQRVPEAEAMLQQADPEHADVSFKQAVIRFLGDDPAQHIAAQSTLMQAAQRADGEGALAINLLLERGDLSREDAHALIRLAGEHSPGVGPSLRMKALLAFLQRETEVQRSKWLDDEDRRADWLDMQGKLRHLRVLAALKDAPRSLTFLNKHASSLRAKHAADYWNLRLEALAQSGRWPQVRDEMQQLPPRMVPVYLLSLWQACASAALDHDSVAVARYLDAAWSEASSLRPAALRTVETAMQLGESDRALKWLEHLAQASRSPAQRVDLWERTMEPLTLRRDTAALAKRARDIALLTPGDPANELRAHYLALLTGASAEHIVPSLHTLGTTRLSASTQAQSHLLWAMIYDQRGQHDLCEREMQALDLKADWPAGQRAVIASLLAKTGQSAKAWEWSQKIPRPLLLPEEAARLTAAVDGEEPKGAN